MNFEDVQTTKACQLIAHVRSECGLLWSGGRRMHACVHAGQYTVWVDVCRLLACLQLYEHMGFALQL